MNTLTIRFFFLVALITCAAQATLAQKSSKEIKADKLFDNYSFAQAAEKYKAVDGLSLEGQRRLAEALLHTRSFEASKAAYEAFIQSSTATAEDYFNYASVLRMLGDYSGSDQWMQRFQSAAPNDQRAVNYVSNAELIDKLRTDQGQFKIRELDINSAQQDFGPAYMNDKVVFASSREGVKAVKRNYNWNGKPFLDVYIADESGNKLKNPRPYRSDVNKKWHEGPAAFNQAADFMAFTRNNYNGKGEDGVVRLQLYFMSKNNDGWSDPEPYALNSPEYSIGHPWLSGDGKTMIFASDMPGGIGGVDLWSASRLSDGSWSAPVNLGATINTEGNEMFPFVHEDGKLLFFASNGHFGLGGLDILVAQWNGSPSNPINLGAPLNTTQDDFALILSKDMKAGYFSSNRDGGAGDDDIYAFDVLKPFNFGVIIRGTAKDKQGNILANAEVTLFDTEGNPVETRTTDDSGKYEFVVEKGKEWALSGTKEGYFDGKNKASTNTDKEVVIADVDLDKDPGLSLYALVTDKETGMPIPGVVITMTNKITGEVKQVTTGVEGDYLEPLRESKLNDKLSYDLRFEAPGYLAKTLTYEKVMDREGRYDVHKALDLRLDKITEGETRLEDLIAINPIYFDLGKHAIRKDAAIELDKIVTVMNENPTMVIELGSHTDCRSSYAFNEKLSDRRAKASAEYIKKRISNPDRIYGKGYGESQLKVDCPCEGAVKSDCSEEEHQRNRRTEFKIIKM